MGRRQLQGVRVVQELNVSVEIWVFLLEGGQHRVDTAHDKGRSVPRYPSRVHGKLARPRYHVALGPPRNHRWRRDCVAKIPIGDTADFSSPLGEPLHEVGYFFNGVYPELRVACVATSPVDRY